MFRAALRQQDRLHQFVPLLWESGRVKRVARGTLAAEAYAMGETVEVTEWVRHILTELTDVTAPWRGWARA